MAANSKIAWTDATWNPVVGCTVVSPGCTNCYAMKWAWRHGHNPATPQYHGLTEKVNGRPVWNGKVAFAEKALTAPLHWKKPKRIFVNSMGDLYHEAVPVEWIDRSFDVMEEAERHTFQVLTKRSARQRDYINKRYGCDGAPAHIWCGVSVEDQERADIRIPDLDETFAEIRFISYEPAVGFVDFSPWLRWLSWVVFGCESGPKRRPYELDWARQTRDDCQAAGVAYFLKQTIENGRVVETPKLDGRPWTEFPG